MSMKRTLLAVALAAAPLAALAGGSADAFYTNSNGKDGERSRGDGYGVRATADLNDMLQLSGLYQTGTQKAQTSGTKVDVDELRVGITARHRVDTITLLGGVERVQYQGTERGTSDAGSTRGFVAKVGAGTHVSKVALKATAGYINLDNKTDGHEVEVSAAAPLVNQISGFADYRYTRVKDNADATATDNLVRVGLRYAF